MARFSARCWKNCATCEFWTGPREFNELLDAAEVEEMAQGNCDAEGKGARSYATTSCIRWRRWSSSTSTGATRWSQPTCAQLGATSKNRFE